MKTRSAGGRLSAALPSLGLISWGLVSCTMAEAWADPFLPRDDGMVLEHLPGATDRSATRVRGLRRLLARAPDQIDLALRVANEEIALGRSEGDPRHYGRAEAALAPWLHLPNPPPEVLLLRATLLQNRHDFDAAVADLDRLIAADHRNARALLLRATVRQVRGDYAGAAADCQDLGPLAEPAVVATCLASIDAVTGRGEVALASLANAAVRFTQNSEPELLLWALTLTGETAARLGREADSEAAFRRATGLGLRDVYLLGAFADFLLDQDRPAEVVALLKDETRVDPLLLRLALAEQRLGLPEASQHQDDLAARFETARRRGDTIHRREEARFQLALARDPDAALELAVANWSVQREPADARIALEAATAAGRPEAAAAVLAWVGTSRIEDIHIARLAARIVSQSKG